MESTLRKEIKKYIEQRKIFNARLNKILAVLLDNHQALNLNYTENGEALIAIDSGNINNVFFDGENIQMDLTDISTIFYAGDFEKQLKEFTETLVRISNHA